MDKYFNWFCFLLLSLGLISCQFKKAELGTAENPIKLFFVPSVEAQVLEDQSAKIRSILQNLTGYKFEVRIPTSYIAVVEAFGAKRADIAALNTFGYILAHEKYGAEALLTVLRHGSATYRSQFLARADDSSIKSISDLNGKKVAFVDPASTSGYLLPLKLLNDKGVKPSESVFAMKHDNVVSMIYQKQVDAGATFYSPPAKGELQDARRLVLAQYPDVEKKIKIVELTDSIPNEPVVFRKDIPQPMKEKIVEAFLQLAKMPEGKEALLKVSAITELRKTNDSEYEDVRSMLKALGQSAEKLMSKNKMAKPILQVRDLEKTYPNGVQALKKVSFDVDPGEFLVIIGLSGSGKSTLLRCLNHLHHPTAGKILFHDKDITQVEGEELRWVRQKMAMIFQHFNLVERHSVIGNVLTGALGRTNTLNSFFALYAQSDKSKAKKYLDLVGIGDKAYYRADQLSGGQQQRVAIARALTQDPEILLADEPVASLDPATCHVVMDYLKKVNQELGMTVVCNLHFLSLVRQYATRVIALKAGKIVYQGLPEEIDEAWFEKIYGQGAKEVHIN